MSKESRVRNVQKWRKRRKDEFIDMLGGKCSKCGYDKCRAALDFHHVDPQTKKYGIATFWATPRAIEIMTEEVKKCVLLCKNCHAEIHYGETNIRP